MAMVVEDDMRETSSWALQVRNVRDWLDNLNPFKWINTFSIQAAYTTRAWCLTCSVVVSSALALICIALLPFEKKWEE